MGTTGGGRLRAKPPFVKARRYENRIEMDLRKIYSEDVNWLQFSLSCLMAMSEISVPLVLDEK